MKRSRYVWGILVLILLLAGGGASAQIGAPEAGDLQPDLPVGIAWSYQTNQAYDPALDHRAMWAGDKCDFNHDGFDDLVIGKRDYNSPTLDNGIAWLFLGSITGLPASPSLTFTPPFNNTYGFFGTQARCAGDVNGDGYDDIIIGADNYDSAYSDEGAVYVYHGSNPPNATHEWMAHGDSIYAHFGFQVDSAGDITGDGYDDIIVGANGNDNTSPAVVTAAYVWYGGASGLGATGTPANADWKATDATLAMRWAGSVRGIGDVNRDGYDDVLVGAPYYDGGFTNQGAVFVYYGSSTGLGANGTTANADWKASALQDSAIFGWSADGIGDVNQDGYDDLAVGAYGYDNSEVNEGKVFVWYGSASGLGVDGTPANADWSAEANSASAQLGWAVAPAEDVNGDGIADLLATAYAYPPGGAWFVWIGTGSGLGSPGTPQNAWWSGISDQSGSYLGRENASALDANGDGKDDIFVVASRYSNPETSEGMAFGYWSNSHLYLPWVMR